VKTKIILAVVGYISPMLIWMDLLTLLVGRSTGHFTFLESCLLDNFMEAKIKSTKSALPENISRATTLEIDEPSSAGDVFHILTSYPKIKKVRVAGIDYKREQIGKLTFADRLGNAATGMGATTHEELRQIFDGGAVPWDVPVPIAHRPQAPPAPIQTPTQTREDYLRAYEQTAQGVAQSAQQPEAAQERAARHAQVLRGYDFGDSIVAASETPF
jgi:hypothetical protein